MYCLTHNKIRFSKSLLFITYAIFFLTPRILNKTILLIVPEIFFCCLWSEYTILHRVIKYQTFEIDKTYQILEVPLKIQYLKCLKTDLKTSIPQNPQKAQTSKSQNLKNLRNLKTMHIRN